MKKEYDFKHAQKGPVVPHKGKTRITIFLDNEVLDKFRARAKEAGYGYQTMINEALKKHLEIGKKPVDEFVLRQIIREELQRVAH